MDLFYVSEAQPPSINS